MRALTGRAAERPISRRIAVGACAASLTLLTTAVAATTAWNSPTSVQDAAADGTWQ